MLMVSFANENLIFKAFLLDTEFLINYFSIDTKLKDQVVLEIQKRWKFIQEQMKKHNVIHQSLCKDLIKEWIGKYIAMQKEIAEKHKTLYSGSFAHIRKIVYICKFGLDSYAKYMYDGDAELEYILDKSVAELLQKQPTLEPIIATPIPPMLTTQGTEIFYPNTSKYFANPLPSKVTSPPNPSEPKAADRGQQTNPRTNIHPTIALNTRRRANNKSPQIQTTPQQPPGSAEKSSTAKKEQPALKKRKAVPGLTLKSSKEYTQEDSSSSEVIPDVVEFEDDTVDFSQSKHELGVK
jgi:hypothetical protein